MKIESKTDKEKAETLSIMETEETRETSKLNEGEEAAVV